ncbi:hypothetical protein Cantr_01309 [Candida viswanathii]|uniref:Uncharacterized protein n=1 Tax=Candida viswanathii TaxID=5486 RepID=A0A367YHU5_9ASCO|nr:hypothetical protein Cantr_01309 [Candida viswanathii]
MNFSTVFAIIVTTLGLVQCITIDEPQLLLFQRGLECPTCTEAANFLIRHCGNIPSNSSYFQSYFECVCHLERGFFIMFERCIDECDSFDFLHISSNSTDDLHNHYCEVADKISEELAHMLSTTNHGSIEAYATEAYSPHGQTHGNHGTGTDSDDGHTNHGTGGFATETRTFQGTRTIEETHTFGGTRATQTQGATGTTHDTTATHRTTTNHRNGVSSMKVNLMLLLAAYLV